MIAPRLHRSGWHAARVTLLETLEAYYDAAPRPTARSEQVGPFTLFVRTDPTGWPYYARPALGGDVPFTTAHVDAVRARQRELGSPETLEWVHETTPTLLAAARGAGMRVEELPLLVLPAGATPVVPPLPEGARVTVLDADHPDLARVHAVVGSGFAGTDDVPAALPPSRGDLVGAGLLVVAAAYDAHGTLVGGGSHAPRGTTTELAGIAVLPRARRTGLGGALTAALVTDAVTHGVGTAFLSAGDDAVARVYERVGFTRVGTACIANASAA